MRIACYHVIYSIDYQATRTLLNLTGTFCTSYTIK